MQRERVADDICVFTSEEYAQVTASAIITSEGSILIDTLIFPEETRDIHYFLEKRLNSPVRYVVNTHHHADHTYGTYLFPDATVISHVRCRDFLEERGQVALEEAKISISELADVEIVLPDIVFDEGTFSIHLGGKTLECWHMPGHSDDGIVCVAAEDRILFAGDLLMPIPYFVDGDYDQMIESLKALKEEGFENVVQGHGEVILRGEVEKKINEDLRYLYALREQIDIALGRRDADKYIETIDVESCGKSRIVLNGQAEYLHRQNMNMLFGRFKEEQATLEKA